LKFNGVGKFLFDAEACAEKNSFLFFSGEFGISGSEFARNRNPKFLFKPSRTSGCAGEPKNRVEPFAVLDFTSGCKGFNILK